MVCVVTVFCSHQFQTDSLNASDIKLLCAGYDLSNTEGIQLSYEDGVPEGYWLEKTDSPRLDVYTVMASYMSSLGTPG